MPSTPSPADPPLRDAFVHAMSRAAATVSVVTTDGPAGLAGLTVSAMTPVSADGDAPTMLVCVNRDASAADPILQNGCFAINVMEAGQQEVADLFAGRRAVMGAERFEGLARERLVTGAPVLRALANFDCEVQAVDPIGTHHVILGAVRAVRCQETGSPLIYGMRSYLRAERA
jgi:flavin reductase (DIM6/NTAB) family NADH-FMN oxidoreductase RutF